MTAERRALLGDHKASKRLSAEEFEMLEGME